MPNIRTYENKTEGLQPSDRGIQAADSAAQASAIAGRSVMASYEQLGREVGSTVAYGGERYQEHVTRQEMQTGLKNQAGLVTNLTASWHDAVARDAASDVHDPHLYETWANEHMKPALDQMDASFSTTKSQAWWTEQKATLTQHFLERGLADTSSLAGVQAVLDAKQTANAAEALAYQDPTSANLARGMVSQSVNAAIANLGQLATPEAIATLKEHNGVQMAAITLAQGRGIIDTASDPVAAAKQFLDTPEATQHLDGSQRDAIQRYGQQQETVLREKQKAADLQARQQLETEGKAYFARLRASMVDDNGQIHSSPEIVQAAKDGAIKYGSVLPGEVNTAFEAVQLANDRASEHKDVQTNPTTFSTLAQGAADGTLTAQDVDKAYLAGFLSNTDYTKLHEMADRTDKDPAERHLQKTLETFLKEKKAAILGMDPAGRSPARFERYYEFETSMRQAVDVARKGGLNAQQIEKELLDPTSSHYLGRNSLWMGYYTGSPTKYGARTEAAPPVRRTTYSDEGGVPVAHVPIQGAALQQPQWDGKEDLDAYLKRVGRQ